MVDPARRIATGIAVNHMLVVNVKIKRVVRLQRVVRMAAQRFFPTYHLAHIFQNNLTFGQIRQGKHALAVHTGAAGLNAATVR